MSAPLPVVSVDLPADSTAPATARSVLGELTRACPSVRLEGSEIAELLVVVHEACTNVIEHSLGYDGERRFRVEFHRHAGGFAIVIEDDGAAYELPEEAPPAPEELRERGYGLHIMRSWSDDLRLEREGSVNRLTLYRRYRVPARDER